MALAARSHDHYLPKGCERIGTSVSELKTKPRQRRRRESTAHRERTPNASGKALFGPRQCLAACGPASGWALHGAKPSGTEPRCELCELGGANPGIQRRSNQFAVTFPNFRGPDRPRLVPLPWWMMVCRPAPELLGPGRSLLRAGGTSPAGWGGIPNHGWEDVSPVPFTRFGACPSLRASKPANHTGLPASGSGVDRES
jgi:hypothetical protein